MSYQEHKQLCDYGCGQRGKYQFKNGKWCCRSHYLKCPVNRKLKKSNGNPFYGKKHSEESIEIMKIKHRGKKVSEETKSKISESVIGKNNPFYGKKHSEETKKKWKEKNRKGFTGKKHNCNSINFIREASKKRFLDKDFLKRWRKSLNQKPTKPEIFVNDILNELFSESYEYVGDYKTWISGKNPDFINIKNKKIIEVFGSYHHSEKITGISEEKHENERIDHFLKYGYKTLIIWQDELKDVKRLKEKILKFGE